MRLTMIFPLLAAAVAIQPVAADYEYVSQFGSFGTSNGQFDGPRGVAVLSTGRIIVTETGNNRVQNCTPAGVCFDFGEFGVDSGQFDRPREVEVNSADRLFIADRGNDRIQSCAATGSCTDFGGSGSLPGQFQSPRGVAITADGRIVVADTNNNRIQICTEQGSCTAFGAAGAGLGQFSSPAGVAVDSQDRIIVADRGNNRIQVCTETGSCTAFGSPGTGIGQFDTPAGVAVDSQDRIIVADRFNDRVQVCSSQGACTAFGTPGSGNGQLLLPWGVTVDQQDRVIVSDHGNHRIQIFAEPQQAVINAFTASPNPIEAGQSVLLSWSVSNAAQCTPLDGTPAWNALLIDASGGNASIQIDVAGDYLFTIECTGGGSTVSRSVTVTVTPAVPPFLINAGLNDAWFNLATSGQGILVTVFADLGQMFVAWFTYDVERPDASATAILGEPGHRWISAFGPYSGDTAVLTIQLSSGGVFNSPDFPVTSEEIGTLTVVFHNCISATVSYSIPALELEGEVTVERLAPDNVARCEELAAG